MIKPHVVKYLDKIRYVVSTIKEQTQSVIGQAITRGETLGEVDSLHRPSMNMFDDVVGQKFKEPSPMTPLFGAIQLAEPASPPTAPPRKIPLTLAQGYVQALQRQ